MSKHAERRQCFQLKLIIAVVFCDAVFASVYFEDVSAAAGLDYSEGPWLKYGGAAVADLDGDGCPDMLCGHHGGLIAMEIYMNQCNGTFIRNRFRQLRDIHALTPFRTSVYEQRMHFIITPGGGRGENPESSDIVRLSETNTFEKVTERLGMTNFSQRGRGAASLNLRKNGTNDGYSDVVITSAEFGSPDGDQVAFQFQPPGFSHMRNLFGDFMANDVSYVTTVDAKSDGAIHLLMIDPLVMFEITDDYTLSSKSDTVFPKWNTNGPLDGVAAVAEADFDNDGYWDLYVARSATGDLAWRTKNGNTPDISDVLLRGTANGSYENVTVSASVPLDTETRGVTVGDFDNDGWVDILLLIYTGKDLFLMNNGDGTFTTVEATWDKLGNAVGDMATAVDYDRDGSLDLIVSEGDWFNQSHLGHYRVMRNSMPFSSDGEESTLSNFLLVRVGGAKTLLATSLHATVYIDLPDGTTLMRRVGAPGVAVSVSYIELLHFGLGQHDYADLVRILWSDGSGEELSNVTANQYIEVGIL